MSVLGLFWGSLGLFLGLSLTSALGLEFQQLLAHLNLLLQHLSLSHAQLWPGGRASRQKGAVLGQKGAGHYHIRCLRAWLEPRD